jgi:hypothetical protein
MWLLRWFLQLPSLGICRNSDYWGWDWGLGVEPPVMESLELVPVIGGIKFRLGKVSLIWFCIFLEFCFFPEFHAFNVKNSLYSFSANGPGNWVNFSHFRKCVISAIACDTYKIFKFYFLQNYLSLQHCIFLTIKKWWSKHKQSL